MPFVYQPPVEYFLSVVTFAVIPSFCSAADGHISVQVVDQNGDVTPVRAWVEVSGEQLFQPTVPDTATPYARDRSFSCDGRFTMTLPVGKAVVHVEKGKEFVTVHGYSKR